MDSFLVEKCDVLEDIALGAEAKVYTVNLYGTIILCKERLPKKYRLAAIDRKLRKERTTQEVRILQLTQKNNLPTPKLIDLDTQNWIIYMEYLPLDSLKDIIDVVNINVVFNKVGSTISKFHDNDIIHGDLTTSNILVNGNEVYFIDFGLGYISTQIEDKAVDLLVLKHTLESSHSQYADVATSSLFEGYLNEKIDGEAILKRMSEIENRVRYRSH